MPHVTGHFCVCHVELWLLFHDFFPVPGYLDLDLVPGYLGTWVPGYLGTWVPGYLGTWVPGYLGTWVPGYQEGKKSRIRIMRQCGLFFATMWITTMWIMRQCGLLIHIVVIHIFRVHIVVSPIFYVPALCWKK